MKILGSVEAEINGITAVTKGAQEEGRKVK